MDQVGVGGEFLAVATAGQEVEEEGQIVDFGDDFFDAHHGDMHGRSGRWTGRRFLRFR